MRDILTILAGLLILVLVAALAVPPFVDWRERRDWVDAAISKAAGLPVRTEGALDVRLLPSPRLRIERLRIGEPASDEASLLAHFVRAEIALTPLLQGEVRFLDSRIGRLEAKLPTGAGGDWHVSRSLVAGDALRHAWVFENLSVLQLLVTTFDPGTGRTDQVAAEGVRVESQALAGPWRLEGRADGAEFTLVTGALDVAGATAVKLSTAGDGRPRAAFDGRLLLAPGPGDTLLPSLEGGLRVAAGPESGLPWPVVATAQVRAAGRTAELDGIVVEAGEGGVAARLGGTGRIALDERRATLALDGRRVDADALIRTAVPAAPGAGIRAWPLDATLRLDGLALGGEELSGLAARFGIAAGRLTVASLDVAAPGSTRLGLSGTADLGPDGGAEGRVTASTRAADRLLAWLGRLGLGAVPAGIPEGVAADLAAEFVAAHPVTSLRNIRVAIGDSTVTGALRFTAAEGDARARLDAQLAVQNLDLASLPLAPLLAGQAGGVDLGLILDARNVGYGSAERGGRIAARLRQDGAALAIDRLEIADLAGAAASLSGSVAADGSGRIAGRLSARRAAPLVDLVGRPFFGPLAALLPAFLREGAVDLAVTAERPGGASGALVTRLDGTASGGPLAAEITAEGGRTARLSATLATDRAGTWLGGAAPVRPARLRLMGERDGAGTLGLRVEGDVAGLAIATRAPFRLGPDEDGIDSGEADLASADAGPLLSAFGFADAAPVPLSAQVRVERVAGVPRVTVAGRVAGASVEADLFGAARQELGGTLAVDRLSLPWLAGALAAPPGRDAPTALARFAPAPSLPVGGTIAVSAATLDLGRGFAASGATFDLATVPDGIAVRDLAAGFLGGGLTGALTLTRQGGLAAVIGEATLAGASLPGLVGAPVTAGTLDGDLRFGGSGESPAGLAANLGGAGTLSVAGLAVATADPGAAERAASRASRGDDPLSQPRLLALATEELGRAPFAATAPVTGQASLVGGTLRIAPVAAEGAAGSWQGAVSVDLRNATLDIRGALASRALPRGWAGPPPAIGLGWAGPVGRPARSVDVAPLANALASVVLARELERIEIFELDAAERARIAARVEMDRARRVAEEARLARLRAEEAERIRIEAERARLDAERAAGTLPLPPGLFVPTPPAPPAASR